MNEKTLPESDIGRGLTLHPLIDVELRFCRASDVVLRGAGCITKVRHYATRTRVNAVDEKTFWLWSKPEHILFEAWENSDRTDKNRRGESFSRSSITALPATGFLNWKPVRCPSGDSSEL